NSPKPCCNRLNIQSVFFRPGAAVKRRGGVEGKRTRTRLDRPAATERRRQPRAGNVAGDPALPEQLDLRTREVHELQEQQVATSNVLKVISSWSGELKALLKPILENAVRLCEASFGNLLLYENKAFRHVALHTAPKAWAAEQQRAPVARRRFA